MLGPRIIRVPLARSRVLLGPVAGFATGTIAAVVKPLGVGYAITCALAFVLQRKLQYFPSAEPPQHPRLMNPLFADMEEVALTSADGTRLQAWHWPAPAADAEPAAPWWLGEPLASAVHAKMLELRAALPALRGVDVVLFHGNAGHRGDRVTKPGSCLDPSASPTA